MSRKKTPWFSIASGVVACLLILSQVVAYGKQQAKQEEVAKKVEALDEQVDKQAEELDGAQSDQKLIQKDVEVIRNNMAEQKVLLNQVLDAVTKKR